MNLVYVIFTTRSHSTMHCSRRILCEVDLPKAIEFPKLFFFDTLTIQNDQISYIKHVLCVFHPIWVLGGGGSQGV